MDGFLHDLRQAIRALLRAPRFTLLATATLALAIGASTLVFTAVSALVLHPFVFDGVERVRVLEENTPQCTACDASPGNFGDWRAEAAGFEAMAASMGWSPSLSGGEGAEQVRGVRATADWFRVLGAEMALGRGFLPGEDAPGGAGVVVLSHDFWTERFGADPRVVGRTLTLNGGAYTVVGVLRAGQGYPGRGQLWTPLVLDAEEAANRADFYLHVLGRLAPGVDDAGARATLAAVTRRLAERHPETNAASTVTLTSLEEYAVAGPRPYLLLLMAAVAFVLAIACVNVANLVLVRATVRVRELAVRAALGARRGRIVRQLLLESVLLALAGGAVGALLAVWGTALLRGALPVQLTRDLPGWANLAVDGRVLAFGLALSVLVGVGFGIFPALGISRPQLTAVLRDGGRGATAGAAAGRARRVLVVAQVALALVLLSGAGLMVRSFAALLGSDPGFRAAGVLAVELGVPGGPNARPPVDFYGPLLERLSTLPGVRAVAATSYLPMDRTSHSQAFSLEGGPAPRPTEEPTAIHQVVTPGYFRAMELPLLRGRDFTAADRAGAPGVVIVGAALAERFFPGREAVGQRLVMDGTPFEVVGVVGDVLHDGPVGGAQPQMYRPHRQAPYRGMTVVLRADGDPLALAPAVRREAAALDRDVGVAEVRTVDRVVADFVAPERATVALLAGFALIALAISAIGIYGVVSFGVVQRTQELGVRAALGATSAQLLRMVVRGGLAVTTLGVVVGGAASVGLTRLMASMLYGVTPGDPLTLATVTGLLVTVALLASWVPARRAARVDPATALRQG